MPNVMGIPTPIRLLPKAYPRGLELEIFPTQRQKPTSYDPPTSITHAPL